MMKFVVSRALFLMMILPLCLSACGGADKVYNANEAHNPYLSKTRNNTHNGMVAMQRKRWLLAEHSFSRALRAAQLSNDMPLIIGAWYNLANAQAAIGNLVEADNAFRHCIRLAERHHDKSMYLRSRLALALMHLKAESLSKPTKMRAWPENLFADGIWPADIHLMAARMMQLQQQPDKASSAYQAVINAHGHARALLSMQAKAHMGLALIARDAGQGNVAWDEAEKVLIVCHRIGMPRLTAHALLLQGQLSAIAGANNSELRVQKLERALDIYSGLNDLNGQRQSLMLLQNLTDSESHKEDLRRYQLRLHQLDAKLGK